MNPPLLPIWACCCLLASTALANARDPFSPSVSSLPVAPPPPPPPSEMEEIVRYLNGHLLVTLVGSSMLVILPATFCGCIVWCTRRQISDLEGIRPSNASKEIPLSLRWGKKRRKVMCRSGAVPMIDYTLLEDATGCFSESNVLAEGVSGCLYKAHFDQGFTAVVKKFNGGKEGEREFENATDLLGVIRHPNIISFLGFCVHGETMFLVYAMMENGTLETQLNGPSHGSALSWHIRMKIAVDTARGLEFLHECRNPPIAHGHLKSSSILLDSKFNVKISDFGLAAAVGRRRKANLKPSDALGYVSPEYLIKGEPNEKSDVYAFGVILLELLMGRRAAENTEPSQCQSMVSWAVPQITNRLKLPKVVDPVIRNTMDPEHLCLVAAIALLCVQPEPCYRPMIADVLYSLVPLLPVELGGTLRVVEPSA